MPDVDLAIVIRHCSRCAAKTELCVTVSRSLSSGFFQFQSLHGIPSYFQCWCSSKKTENILNSRISENYSALEIAGVSRRPTLQKIRNPNIEIRNSEELLLRKEVIQPQVPLRLPCYDFIPVTAHSVGDCLLAVSTPISATSDFHDVTGGVYKARERIHGAVADAPLLAIPAS